MWTKTLLRLRHCYWPGIIYTGIFYWQMAIKQAVLLNPDFSIEMVQRS